MCTATQEVLPTQAYLKPMYIASSSCQRLDPNFLTCLAVRNGNICMSMLPICIMAGAFTWLHGQDEQKFGSVACLLYIQGSLQPHLMCSSGGVCKPSTASARATMVQTCTSFAWWFFSCGKGVGAEKCAHTFQRNPVTEPACCPLRHIPHVDL